MGGCNPLWSNKPTSCMPAPVCKNATYDLTDASRILSNATLYNGNATEHDFIVDKGNIQQTNGSDGELAVILTETNGGTRLSSTRYVHYGRITATLKSGRWKGVVTAFITMADSKDEIDWEFPGNATTQGQTNLYWEGVPNYNNGQTIDNVSDTFFNYHDYTIDWKPDTLTFEIDNKVVRTVKKSDLKGAFPTAPSRVQISIWPAGIQGSPQGTIDWAGGMIDWNDPDYKAAGNQFYARFKSLKVECADPEPVSADDISYVFGSNITTPEGLSVPQVAITNQSTVMNGATSILNGISAWKFWSTLLVGGSILLY